MLKRETRLCVTMLSMVCMAHAGGDIVIEEINPSTHVETQSMFYAGTGIGRSSVRNDFTKEEISDTTLLLLAGYQFNPYFALEGRTHYGFNTNYDRGNLSPRTYTGKYFDWGVYLKPMYPLGQFNIYALLGYGGILQYDLDKGDAYESAFHWGLGAGYNINENITVFVDYTSLYNDTGFDYRATTRQIDADIWTLGVSYKF